MLWKISTKNIFIIIQESLLKNIQIRQRSFETDNFYRLKSLLKHPQKILNKFPQGSPTKFDNYDLIQN
jgi:hypothetical protein